MSMIHEQNFFRSGVKRLFTGTPQEWFGELIQNAQRAEATRFSVQFIGDDQCVVHDNGHGLFGGLHDLERMLIFSDSAFSQEVQSNQHPMGMGCYALIANEAISLLRVESQYLSFELDTQQWLDDSDYRNAWRERVVEAEVYVAGFRITVIGTTDLMKQARACICNTYASQASQNILAYRGDVAISPFCGYADLLEVEVDGEQLSLDLPDTMTIPDSHIVGTYQGNLIRISLFGTPSERSLYLNWYGQIISTDSRVSWRAYMEVRTGRPVTPRAPTRDGLVVDQQLLALYQWIEDQIFTWVCAQKQPKVSYVEQLFAINSERASRECPFAIVQPRRPLPRDYVFSSLNDFQETTYESYLLRDVEHRSSDELDPKRIVRKEDVTSLLVLADEVYVPLQGNHPAQPLLIRDDLSHAEEIIPVAFELGLASLLRATGITAFKADRGMQPKSCVWWRPGEMVDTYYTMHLGEWGIGTFARNEQGEKVALPPETWHPLTEDFVYVASESNGWDITEVAWIIGITSSEEIVPFLEQYGCAALWVDDEREDESIDAYADTVDALIRTYLPNTIARNTVLRTLCETVQPLLQGHDVSTATVSFILDKRKRLNSLRFAFSDGYEQDIKLY